MTTEDPEILNFSNTYCLSRFTTSFITQFDLAAKDYAESIQPGRGAKAKKSTFVHGVGTGIGGILDGVLTLVLGVPGVASAAGTSGGMVGNYLHNKFQFREKGKKVVATLQSSDSSKEKFYDVKQQRQNLYKILVQGATQVFVAFEEIFCAVGKHDLRDLDKIAHDAVCRVFNYLSKSNLKEFSSQSICRGVLEGDSKLSTLGKATRSKSTGHKIYFVKQTNIKKSDDEDDTKSKKQKNLLGKLKLSNVSKSITQNVYSQPKLSRDENAVKLYSCDLFNFSGVLFPSGNNPFQKYTVYARDKEMLHLYGCRLSFEGESREDLDSLGYKLLDNVVDDNYAEKRINNEELTEASEKILKDLEDNWNKLHHHISAVHQEVQHVGNVLNDKFDNITRTLQLPTIQKEISFLPFPKPDQNFTGRTKLICEVIKSLTSLEKNPSHQIGFPLINLYGLGGHGKTQTAQSIAEICIKENIFTGVIWIEAEKQFEITKQINRELTNQGINDIPENDAVLVASKLYDLIISKSKQKILVIFDNVEGFKQVKEYLPLNKRLNNTCVLLTSVEKITIPTGLGEIGTFKVDILEEMDAKDLAVKILKGSVLYTESDISNLVSESGRIPVILCIMASTITSVSSLRSYPYTISQFLQEVKDKSKIIRYPNNSNTEEDLNLSYQKSLYTCVKFALEKIEKSNHPYASLAIHFIERYVHFNIDSPINYFLDHVTTIRQDIQHILKDALVPLEPSEVLKNAIRLASKFSLITIRDEGNYIMFRITLGMHRLVQTTLRLIQADEKRDNKIVEDLIGCQDYPKFEFLMIELYTRRFIRAHAIATLWSNASNYEELIRKYFMEKGSFIILIEHELFDVVRKIVQILGDIDSANKILQLEPYEHCFRNMPRNGLYVALKNDFHQLGKDFIRILKNNRNNISNQLWDQGLTSALQFWINDTNLDVMTELVETFEIDGEFLSRRYCQESLLCQAVCRDVEIANYLLQKNISPSTKDSFGETALHRLISRWADQEPNNLVAQIVSKYPKSVYEKSDDGSLPFMTAASHGCKTALIFLLKNMDPSQFQIDFADNKGNTALMNAFQNFPYRSTPDIIKVLINHGADVHYRNSLNSWNAWHYAFLKMNFFTERYKKDNDKFGLSNVFKILVENRIAPNLLDNNGDTFLNFVVPWDKCTVNGKSNITELIGLITSNGLGGIFDCQNDHNLTVFELAEKLKISGRECIDNQKDDAFSANWNQENSKPCVRFMVLSRPTGSDHHNMGLMGPDP